MRLWTFQTIKAYESVKKYGVWYADLDHADRLKPVDEQYIQEEFETPEGIIDTMPIYCFASMGKYYMNLCISTMYGQYNHLVGWMQFPLERMAMFELEVPESFILSSKKHNKWYVEYPDMPKDVRKYDKWKYEKIVDEDEIELHNHLAYKRSIEGDDVECLIPYISLEHIAAVRLFKPVNSKEAGYGTCRVTTDYVGKEVPLWTKTIYCNGDGYPRYVKDSKLVMGSFDMVNEMRSKYGMPCTYDYMTIEDIADCCNESVYSVVRSLIKSKDKEYKDIKDLTLEELQNL